MTETTQTTPAIELRQLGFRYPNGCCALEGIELSIGSGERVGLVGPSGAGKSTLLLHLNGLLPDPLPKENAREQEFAVFIHGKPVTKSSATSIRQQVGLVFQNPDDQLFCPTVEEDIAFGPLNQGHPREEVRETVSCRLKDVLLDGYGSRRIFELSLGEKKRVALAGILACEPAILALDEPFSNLDPRSRRQLLQILDAFEGTQLIATHDLDIVLEFCTRVVVLDRGRIQADGSTREILSDPILMERHGLEVPFRLRHGE